ncbi:hypothetical protein [Wolbachia endosymbiont of Chironomus riparius]|uniref:hypothetical protein n=1 Tax=Wolbachia endosymbiont of Chironomus riparius TaxID=2883238 RepID=UPI0020A065C9|nr:hypothetical protein [Wolbachia endosymbiont of Chironomus riparius]
MKTNEEEYFRESIIDDIMMDRIIIDHLKTEEEKALKTEKRNNTQAKSFQSLKEAKDYIEQAVNEFSLVQKDQINREHNYPESVVSATCKVVVEKNPSSRVYNLRVRNHSGKNCIACYNSC